MKHLIGTLACAALLSLVIPAAEVAAQQARPAAKAEAKSIWTGVYTEAQAARGEAIGKRECAACHGSQEWSRPAFLSSWYGRSANELFQHISSTMPMDGPGRLSAQEYTDVIAYMMKLHGAPAGKTELKGENAALRAVVISPKAQ